MYSAVFGCSVLLILIKSNWSTVSFRTSVTLLIFCLDDLSVDVSVVLKSPALIVFLSVSHFISVNICVIYLAAPILCAHMLTSNNLFLILIFLSVHNALLCFSLWPLF